MYAGFFGSCRVVCLSYVYAGLCSVLTSEGCVRPIENTSSGVFIDCTELPLLEKPDAHSDHHSWSDEVRVEDSTLQLRPSRIRMKTTWSRWHSWCFGVTSLQYCFHLPLYASIKAHTISILDCKCFKRAFHSDSELEMGNAPVYCPDHLFVTNQITVVEISR